MTIDIAPRPATPLETEITYLPAVLPAERKSVTLFISPFVKLTEYIIPPRTIIITNQSINAKFIPPRPYHLYE